MLPRFTLRESQSESEVHGIAGGGGEACGHWKAAIATIQLLLLLLLLHSAWVVLTHCPVLAQHTRS